ncbi:hypothetical protein V2H45_23745 [Tumidithrix elongata RA019]|uniref:Uncharacterized protein n=1 Tax=Tumidithrix elongata BACA0141 TaxID=2716417 RepID=A0AAW9Q981_9CYAN|nr:hypothetical protein [Tumidithrix elongata RA019]
MNKYLCRINFTMKALLNLNFIYRFFPFLIIALPLFTVFGSLPASARCNGILDCPVLDPTDSRFNPGELADPLKVWFEHNPGLSILHLDIGVIVAAGVKSGKVTNRQQCYSFVDTTVDNLNRQVPNDVQRFSGYSSLVQQKKNSGREDCNRLLASNSGSGGVNTVACSSTYDPRPYRPGTSGWTGRVGQIAFNNGTSASVRVTLFHPDAPTRAFKSWNVQPRQNLFLGGDNYGMDWGIQVDNSPICIVGSVSDWNSFNGSQIFQTWVERVPR